MDITIGQIFEYANKASVVVVLGVAILGFYKGWWITGREHANLLKRIDTLEAKDEKWHELFTRTIQSVAPPGKF